MKKFYFFILVFIVLITALLIYRSIPQKYAYSGGDKNKEYPYLNLEPFERNPFNGKKSFREVCAMYHIDDDELSSIDYMHFEYYNQESIGTRQENIIDKPGNYEDAHITHDEQTPVDDKYEMSEINNASICIECYDKDIIRFCIEKLNELEFVYMYQTPYFSQLYDVVDTFEYTGTAGTTETDGIENYLNILNTNKDEYFRKGGFIRFYIEYDHPEERRHKNIYTGLCIDITPLGVIVYNSPDGLDGNYFQIFASPSDYALSVEKFNEMYLYLNDNLSDDCQIEEMGFLRQVSQW